MRFIFTIILLFMIFCSGGFAQSRPNSFDMALDKNAKEVRCVSCEENGFCVVAESKSRKVHQFTFAHVDTLMKAQWDTIVRLPQEWQLSGVFYDDGSLVILCRTCDKTRLTDQMTILQYNTATRKMVTREISGLPGTTTLTDWHFFQGNIFFTSRTKNGDGVWYLPAGHKQPFPFTFTQENPGRVLTTAVDTIQGKAILCFNSGERTMYFETDFQGKSSFANILNEAATHAQWIPVGRDHSLLMLYYHDDEIFFMHPVNILNHKVTPADTVFCADIYSPKSLPKGVSAKKMVIVAPHNYAMFYPTHAQCEGEKVSCVTELYYPEYSNYFNGWYVEPRFDGYHYIRADVHFFDTNGVFQTNVTFPYDETMALHPSVLKLLNVSYLPDGNILFYHLGSRELTTMLLDSECKLESPVNTVDVPMLRPSAAGKYKVVPADMKLWYSNRFLLTAYKVALGSQRKLGLTVSKLEYN